MLDAPDSEDENDEVLLAERFLLTPAGIRTGIYVCILILMIIVVIMTIMMMMMYI
jgi:hypothetical protein